MDSLRRRVLARDTAHNSERAIEVTTRAVVHRLICLECRHMPDSNALLNKWEKEHPSPWVGPRPRWPGLQGKCPECGERLVELTW